MLVVTSKRKLKKFLKNAAFILLLVLIFLYFNHVVYPLVLDIAESKAKVYVMNAINEAAVKIRSLQEFYGEFYKYERNNDGEIVLITANTGAINKMYMCSQAEIQQALNNLNKKVVELPLGAFTGSAVFAEYGPTVNINLMLVGASEAMWNSYFYNEGINQTIHRVILRVTTRMRVIIPLRASDITVNTDIVIAEDIILGRVPESYITGLSEDNIFDLLP